MIQVSANLSLKVQGATLIQTQPTAQSREKSALMSPQSATVARVG